MMPLIGERTLQVLTMIDKHGDADAAQVNEGFDHVAKTGAQDFLIIEARGWVVRIGRTPSLPSLIRRKLTPLGKLLLAYATAERAEHKRLRQARQR